MLVFLGHSGVGGGRGTGGWGGRGGAVLLVLSRMVARRARTTFFFVNDFGVGERTRVRWKRAKKKENGKRAAS